MDPFPLYPPARWFQRPDDLVPGQRLQVITEGPDAGRVAGYVAPWGQCLLGGNPSECFTAPSSPTAYAAAMQGDTVTAEGHAIKTANIGGGINHAPTHPGEFSQRVVDHYANTASQTMRVVYGEDEYGIWAAGALWPDLTEEQVAKVRASALSGDWRWRREYDAWDMAGSQLVSVPGFPLIRGVAAACGAHPILVGGMGGVPSDMLEEDLMDDANTATLTGPQPLATATSPLAAPPAARAAACSCGGQPEEPPAAETAAPGDAVVVAPETPDQEATPPTAAETQVAELTQRLEDAEAAIAELSERLGEAEAWLADTAASSMDDPESMAAALPEPRVAAPPSPNHEFVDDGSGKCETCGMPEAMHSESAPAADEQAA